MRKQQGGGGGPRQQEGQKGDHTTQEEEGPQRDDWMPHVWQGNPAQAEPPRPHPKPAQRESSGGMMALTCLQGKDLQVTSQPQGPYEQEEQGLRRHQGTRSKPPGQIRQAPKLDSHL